jgi:CubicO group peptidase (beta-lactamase class C family)
MQLCEGGKLELDDPANSHLGDVRIRNEWEDANPVTVRQLLTHTSGLPCDADAIPDTSRTVTLAQWVNAVAKTVRPPGGEIVYANWGYDALGPLIDCLSTQSWQEHIRSRIFAQMGMASSDIGDVVPGKPTATGHFLSAVDDELHAMKPVWPWELMDTSGSISSSVEDMGRFLSAHLSGGTRLLTAKSTQEMQRVHASEGPPTSGID